MSDEEILKDEICEYVHNLHKVEPFNGFTYRDLRDVAEHFALPREKRIAELEAQIEKMKSDVISERDEAKRLEDIITYTVLNNILAKWGIKEK